MAISDTDRSGNGKRSAPGGRTPRQAPPGRKLEIAPPDDEGPLSAAARAAEALGPEAGLAAADPMSFGKALAQFGAEIARRPVPTAQALGRYGAGMAVAAAAAAGRAMGLDTPEAVPPPPKDKRFVDPAWERNAAFFGLLQSYRLFDRLVDDLLKVADLEEPWGGKARFALRGMVDALAPTNFFWTNPAALKRAFDTGGWSLVRGMRNFLNDLVTNDGLPQKVDRSAFRLGENLATTPGKVVFRNELMELMQYAPATDTVHEIPLLSSPPWINKYYIMDLAPERSFVEWAVKQGHTVFQISYRNPDRSMGGVRLDDYLLEGPRTALDVIGDITGATKVNMVGLCLGGTLTAMLLAWLAARGDDRVNSATLLNTLIDFSRPGVLGAFSDPEAVARVEARMAKRGYLESDEMSRTFDFMRANDLIWSYVASNWLMGEDPPAFDILAWNADGTRMPAAMHSFYLRACYIENQLARGEMELAGTRLNLADAYLLSAKEDHIAPWKAAYATTQLLAGNVRFVLSSSGHIAGIVNPPSPKSKHWTNSENPPDPEAWLATAEEHQGSWWEDWTAWIGERAGGRRPPPPLGNDRYKPIGDAPGTYVRES
jgi:polyhydroxyalkanoate synthase